MIRLIEALNYRSLCYVRQPLHDFQILVGPNASGKSSFLDVVGFLSDLLTVGLDRAISNRTSNIDDLFFYRRGDRFELAVELEIPKSRRERLRSDAEYRLIRYEVSVGIDRELSEHRILDEQVQLLEKPSAEDSCGARELFPNPELAPDTIMQTKPSRAGRRRTVRKVRDGNDNFYPEIGERKSQGGWGPSIRLGPRKSALANLPEDETGFPISTWLRRTLVEGTQTLMLNSVALRQSSPPGQGLLFKPDGSNLPWVVADLRAKDADAFGKWIAQIQTALPDVVDISTQDFPDRRHRFLQVHYRGDLVVPSWTLSDGTLRLLALTLPAYLADFEGIYLIEEPENGIHPMAMESVFQSLRAAYDAQILLATHSPVLLGCANESDILCFKKTVQGATDIVRGDRHPALKHWRGNLNLSDLYASGVLG